MSAKVARYSTVFTSLLAAVLLFISFSSPTSSFPSFVTESSLAAASAVPRPIAGHDSAKRDCPPDGADTRKFLPYLVALLNRNVAVASRCLAEGDTTEKPIDWEKVEAHSARLDRVITELEDHFLRPGATAPHPPVSPGSGTNDASGATEELFDWFLREGTSSESGEDEERTWPTPKSAGPAKTRRSNDPQKDVIAFDVEDIRNKRRKTADPGTDFPEKLRILPDSTADDDDEFFAPRLDVRSRPDGDDRNRVNAGKLVFDVIAINKRLAELIARLDCGPNAAAVIRRKMLLTTGDGPTNAAARQVAELCEQEKKAVGRSHRRRGTEEDAVVPTDAPQRAISDEELEAEDSPSEVLGVRVDSGTKEVFLFADAILTASAEAVEGTSTDDEDVQSSAQETTSRSVEPSSTPETSTSASDAVHPEHLPPAPTAAAPDWTSMTDGRESGSSGQSVGTTETSLPEVIAANKAAENVTGGAEGPKSSPPYHATSLATAPVDTTTGMSIVPFPKIRKANMEHGADDDADALWGTTETITIDEGEFHRKVIMIIGIVSLMGIVTIAILVLLRKSVVSRGAIDVSSDADVEAETPPDISPSAGHRAKVKASLEADGSPRRKMKESFKLACKRSRSTVV